MAMRRASSNARICRSRAIERKTELHRALAGVTLEVTLRILDQSPP